MTMEVLLYGKLRSSFYNFYSRPQYRPWGSETQSAKGKFGITQNENALDGYFVAFEISTLTGKFKKLPGLYGKNEKHENRELTECKLQVLIDNSQHLQRLLKKQPNAFTLKLEHELPHLLYRILQQNKGRPCKWWYS